MRSRLDKLLVWYQSLSPDTVDQLDDFYTEDAYFKDPFNEFRSRENIRQTYMHMFSTLDHPKFYIKSSVIEGRQAFAIWDMEFGFHGKTLSIHGCSHFGFAEDGRVQSHRDYWDASEEFYEKIPVLGWLLKGIKRKIKTQTTQA